MAYKCPHCGKEKLSSRKLEVKFCLDCNKIVGCNDILEFLRKIGIQEVVESSTCSFRHLFVNTLHNPKEIRFIQIHASSYVVLGKLHGGNQFSR